MGGQAWRSHRTRRPPESARRGGFFKERIARAGVEHRRALREAVLEEREACAQVCDELVNADACARQIRARN